MLLATADCPSPITAPDGGEDKDTLYYLSACFHCRTKNNTGINREEEEEPQQRLNKVKESHVTSSYLKEKSDVSRGNNSMWKYSPICQLFHCQH
jgi:hypothetical protein